MKQPRAVGIGVRRALAGEVGQEEQALGCRAATGGFVGEHVVGIDFCFFAAIACLAELVAEPLQRAAAGQADAHHVPLAVDGVAERVQPAARVDLRLVAVHEHDAARCRSRWRATPRLTMPLPTALAAQSPAPPTTTQSVERPSCLRHGWRQLAGDFFRFIAVGEQVDVELQLAEQLLRPVALGHVEQQHAAGVADFGGELAGQPAADVVLGQQHFRQSWQSSSARCSAAREFSAR